MDTVSIGVLGGSGLYRMKELTDQSSVTVDTPFGRPSDEIVVGTLAGRRVAFLPRHGRGHRLLPSEIPYLANIHALRQLGVRHLISVSAVGSMREEIAPGHICLPDQFIDLTQGRPRTFFGGGVVGHIPFNKPVCADLARGAPPRREEGRRRHARRRHLRLHRGAAILDDRRVHALSLLGRRRHRDDQPPRGPPRARGRDVLRDPRPGHRLRLLARDRGGLGGADSQDHRPERQPRPGDHPPRGDA